MSDNMIVSFDRSNYAEAFKKAKNPQDFVELFWYLSTWGAIGDAQEEDTRVALHFYPELGEAGASYSRNGKPVYYIHAVEGYAGTWTTHS